MEKKFQRKCRIVGLFLKLFKKYFGTLVIYVRCSWVIAGSYLLGILRNIILWKSIQKHDLLLIIHARENQSLFSGLFIIYIYIYIFGVKR